MKMWKNIFGGKKEEKFVEEKNTEMTAEEALKAQDAPRIEPLKGTEAEIEKQAEEGMVAMGFKPVENTSEIEKQVEDSLKTIAHKPVEENKELTEITESKTGAWKPRIRGNDYCPCGSNKKFKKCCVADEKAVKKFEKRMDIRLANEKTIRKLKNEEKRMAKREKISEKNKEKNVAN